jgi:hypothetical protein
MNTLANQGNVTFAATTPSYKLTDTSGVRSVRIDELIDFMEGMKDRLLMIAPLFEKHEHYPALKTAYDEYRMIERMCEAATRVSP